MPQTTVQPVIRGALFRTYAVVGGRWIQTSSKLLKIQD
jgi:hypothetical protein